MTYYNGKMAVINPQERCLKKNMNTQNTTKQKPIAELTDVELERAFLQVSFQHADAGALQNVLLNEIVKRQAARQALNEANKEPLPNKEHSGFVD